MSKKSEEKYPGKEIYHRWNRLFYEELQKESVGEWEIHWKNILELNYQNIFEMGNAQQNS